MTAKKATCGTGLKISILHYMAASQVSFLTSLIDKFHNCNMNGYFPAMHKKLDLKIITIKYKNVAVMATLKSAYILYKRTEHNQEWESIHL